MLVSKIKQTANRLYYGAARNLGFASRGDADDLIPPDWMFADPDRVDGSHSVQEFISIGDDTAAWFIDSEGLAPHHRVLDVGCGIGRIARPLTKHLKDGGSYDGIEIAAYKIKYCRETVGTRFSNFKFHHADVFNKYYNPSGKMKACEYSFPFPNGWFDFVYLVSVFTHMLPADLEHYLSEISRVLKPGAKCIASYWLSDAKIGSPYHSYSDVCEIYRVEEPEHGVVYIENYVKDLYSRYGLEIIRLGYGSWIARPGGSSSHRQDIIVATRRLE